MLSSKVLQIIAEHGALHFSYRDEQRNLPEGQTYRVYLDADEGSATATKGAQTSGPTSELTNFVVSAGAAGGVVWGIDHRFRSSNPPISPAKP